MIGIVDYGFYIPKYRIKVDDVARQWGKCTDKVERSLRVTEKAVAGRDEDMVTMAFEASTMALAGHEGLKKISERYLSDQKRFRMQSSGFYIACRLARPVE
ncbi:hypothetical protein IPM65_01025 [Candidatus Roizmanbacteria bacterium]|nr:MAG: hypothetical protein IPM65_01025 [Candidatus Roizmanbacteria bacterium]